MSKAEILRRVTQRAIPAIYPGSIWKLGSDPNGGPQYPSIEVSIGVDQISAGVSVRANIPAGLQRPYSELLMSARWQEPLPTIERCVQEAIRALQRVAEDQGWSWQP